MTVTAYDAAILSGLGLALVARAFVLSAGLGILAQRRGPQFGLVDFPGGPLRHHIPVSLAGGVSVWLSTDAVVGLAALALGVGRPFLPEAIARYLNGLWYRAGELAVMLATWGSWVTLFWPFTHLLIGGLVTVLWVVGLTNALNFLDNMDGLAAGIGVAASLMFAAAQVQVGSLFAPAVLLVLPGMLGGFLVHNRYPARLFLGDSGSDFLGSLLGAMTVAGTYYRYGEGDSRCNVLSPLLVMAVLTR
jgi:UDP-GlcNAc:undecaprenyl-phosphate GlcNAc-1-phosphate transferase